MRPVSVAAAILVACGSAERPIEHVASARSLAARDATRLGAIARSAGPPEATVGRSRTSDAAPREGPYANLDPDDDAIVAPPAALDDCEVALKRAGVTFRPARLTPFKTKRGRITCGAPQVVTYLRGPANIRYSSPPLLTCGMALALAAFERIAESEALATLKSPIARIDHVGTYNCREMVRYPGWVSEHAYANAIDIGAFVLRDGRTIRVARDFDPAEAGPPTPAGTFLRAVSRRAYDEAVFSDVLTPYFDALHKDHFHLDLARYRTDGTRPGSSP